MNFKNLPCHRCPQHTLLSEHAENLHTCRENWYARIKSVDTTVPANEEYALVKINNTELKQFWKQWKHKCFSCPYRREKFVYKAIPLFFSLFALTISVINSETIKSFFKEKENKPTQIAQPIRVTIEPQPTNQPLEAPIANTSPKELKPSKSTVENTNEKPKTDK